MVRIEEVADEWSDDDGQSSAASEVSESDMQLEKYDPSQETLSDRFYALKDIVPPSTRQSISNSAGYARDWVQWSIGKAGTAAWVTCTSAILVGLPLMLAIEGEGALMAQEAQFQQPGQPGAAQAGAGQQIVPPGF